jgi:hypothetical protein
MMGVVACAAVVVATCSAFASDRGNPLLGLVIVVVCTAGVAGLRTAEGIARLKADGHPQNVGGLVTTITTSIGVATLIVGLADLAFVLAYGLLAGGPQFFLFSADRRSQQIIPEGLIAGAVSGLAVCYLSRKAIWRSSAIQGQFLRLLAPLACVAFLLGAIVLWERTWYRSERADQHDLWAAIHGGESSFPIPLAPTGFRASPEMATYHEQMSRKWKHAAYRPWLSVDPDPPPPEP